jgi:hypothetical protein
LDATSVLRADPSLGLTLPNGLPIPASFNIASGSLMAIPILDSSRVYIGGDLKTSIVIGAALGIKGLDPVMSGVGLPGNIFFTQNFNPTLSGMAGIYASPAANGNGIAVFGKYTLPTQSAPLAVAKFSARQSESASAEIVPVSVSGVTGTTGNEVLNEQVNSDAQKKLINFFYGRKKVLRPH